MEAISLFVSPKPELSAAIERLIAEGALPRTRLSLAPGEYLFREGDDVRSTYYIERGLVRLFSNTPDGYTKTVFFHKAGTLIGFQGFQEREDRKPAILHARATTHCEISVINAERFGAHLRTDGALCYEMARYFFELLALQTRESVNTAIYPILQRFSALLLMLMREFGSAQAPAIIPFSKDELAEMLGVHVNSITNSIVALRNADCVERQRNALVITDFKKLKSIAENLIADSEE